MLVIRKEQIRIFQSRAEERLEEELLQHFLRHYPRESRQAGGREQMRKLVKRGIERAAARGLNTQKLAGLYIALSIMLGAGFEEDPQLPWVADQLSDESLSPSDRVGYLFRTAIDYLGATAGEESEFIVRAMLRTRAWDPASAPETSGTQWENDVCALFEQLYPQKFGFQGEEPTLAMLRIVPDRAGRYGIRSPKGCAVYALHMFMLGNAFDEDLLYPWAAIALKNPRTADEAERVRLLWNGAMLHLNESLSKD